MMSYSAPAEHVAIVDARCSRLSWSRAQFVKAIVDQWIAKGSPAVSDADRALLTLHGPSKQRTG